MKYRFQLFLLFVLLIPCWVIAAHYDIDLVNIYAVAGYLVGDIKRVYGSNGQLGRYFYPPFTLILIKPFAYFSYTVVKWFWIVLQTACYVVFWRGLYRLYPVLKEQKFFWPWILIFIVSINPIHNNFQSNNIQLMLIAMLVAAEVHSRKDGKAQYWAGGLVSLAAWIKVFPAFMAVYYMLVKPKKVKAGLVIGFLFGLLTPLAFFGWEQGISLYRDFYLAVTTYADDNPLTLSPDIMCLPSLLARFFKWVVPVEPQVAAMISKGVIIAVSAVFFTASYYKLVIKKATTQLHFWALALSLTVFLNPSTRPHYFIFFVPAYVSVLAMYHKEKRPFDYFLVVLSVLLVAFTTDAVLGKTLNDKVELLSLPTIGSALISLLLACRLLY